MFPICPVSKTVSLRSFAAVVDGGGPDRIAQVQHRPVVEQELAIEIGKRGRWPLRIKNMLDIGMECRGLCRQRPLVADPTLGRRTVIAFAGHGRERDDLPPFVRQQPRRGRGDRGAVESGAQVRRNGAVHPHAMGTRRLVQ
jgi:hypothetical protein